VWPSNTHYPRSARLQVVRPTVRRAMAWARPSSRSSSATTSYLSNPLNASTVLEQLQSWFEEYNEWAPHKRLRMKSPRQYRRL